MTHPTPEARENGMTNHQLINHKLDEILELSNKHDRALYGVNGDPGLIEDVRSIRKSHTICQETQAHHQIVLEGDPDDREDSGMVGEHSQIMAWYLDVKDNRKWFNRLVVGAVVLDVIATVWLQFFRP